MCRDECRYARYCHEKDSDIVPEDCGMFYRLEELLWDYKQPPEEDEEE